MPNCAVATSSDCVYYTVNMPEVFFEGFLLFFLMLWFIVWYFKTKTI